jgi:ribonuclease BN (tRNA processing enzyme)
MPLSCFLAGFVYHKTPEHGVFIVGAGMKRGKTFLVMVVAMFSFSFIDWSGQMLARSETENRSPDAHQKITQIVLLGTGTPIADPSRSGPCTAIVVNGTPYLIDFGPGVVRRAELARYLLGIRELSARHLKKAFVTHLHSDHTAGYSDLILTSWVLGRDEPLEVYGPKGLRAMTEHILAAYREDIELRIEGLEPINPDGCRVDAHEIEPGVVYRDSNVTVEAFAVKHGSWRHAYGYTFRTPDKVIVISGDTTPTESIVEHSRGCDVLIHEVYSQSGYDLLTPDWQKYHASFHTSTHQLAEIASQAEPKLLVLYHQLFFGVSEKELLQEVQDRYDGKVVSGRDLDVY